MRGWAAAAIVGLLAGGAWAEDQGPSWLDHVTFVGSLRVRGEFVDWFEPPPGTAPKGAERYDFFGSRLRAGFRVLFPHVEFGVDIQNTEITPLPDDATLAPPQGSLGTGATYFLNTHETTQGETFLKQGFLTLRRGGFAATVGRFDYRDGLETVPADATLAEVKRTRIAERLVGPFEFTHVTRGFDGARVVYDDPLWNATALAVRPTDGGFEISANRELEDIDLAGLALTLKRLPFGPPIDCRLFYLYYEDRRRETIKVDNRPLAVRELDHEAISLQTIGAHAMTAFDVGPGIVDLLAWAVGQGGDWGMLQQSAWAYAVEAAYQLPRVPGAPWLRVGIDRSSGDDNPNDGEHGTFFQLLPTARVYAQLPFFDLMNSQDVFTSLILRPHPMVTVRTDYHWLQVTESRDLWYQGSGATNDTVFGYAGSPASGHHDLAQLVDLSVTVTVNRQLTFGGYYGHAFGGDVVGASFQGRDANYGFIEMTLRY